MSRITLQSGVKFKQAINQYSKDLLEGKMRCATLRTNPTDLQTGWGLDTMDPFATGYPFTDPPQYFNNVTSVSMTQFDVPLVALRFEVGFLSHSVDANLEDSWFEDYVYYFVGSNPSNPDFEYAQPLHLANSGHPIDKVTWRWGGYVLFDSSQLVHYRELTSYSTTTPVGAVPAIGANGPVSLTTVVSEEYPPPVTCPGTPDTTNEIDDNSIFVVSLFEDLYHVDFPNGTEQDYWRSQITQCRLDTTCIYGLRSGPYGQRTAVAKAFFFSNTFNSVYPYASDLANPPGSPNFNPSAFNPAYIRALYIVFLKRDPLADGDSGYQWWLNNINSTNNYDGVLDAFITCPEYRARFGPVDPHW